MGHCPLGVNIPLSHCSLAYHRAMPIPERLNPTFATAAEPPAINRFELAREKLIVALDVPDAVFGRRPRCQARRHLSLVQSRPRAIHRRRPRCSRAPSSSAATPSSSTSNSTTSPTLSPGQSAQPPASVPACSPSTPLVVPPCSSPPTPRSPACPTPPLLLAVTMLTSIDQAQAHAIGFSQVLPAIRPSPSPA
jgi:hypothetical protein